MSNESLTEYCDRSLKKITDAGLLRNLQCWENRHSRMVCLDGRELLNFASNDYLGLSTHRRIREALQASVDGCAGAAASRLITGNYAAYETLEREITGFKNAEAALVFTSGYAAALGTIPVLVGKGDFIVMDKLCHACLVDGARLSGATLRIFPHNHLKRCAELLASCQKQAGRDGRVILITESIFSMDGDLAPLADLVELKERYGAWLMVDEAHATGVLGSNGRGGGEHFGVEGQIEVSMGTLSKALGCVGGFICGSQKLKDLLVNRARSLIYSTGLPPAICAAATTAIRLLREETELREKLWKNLRLLEKCLKQKMQSPIIPILIGDEQRCMEVAGRLRKRGVMVPAVRYPTVGRGKARLRVSINAMHTEEDILRLATLLPAMA